MSLPRIEAIIWDCDGVLIDSETLACQAAVDMLAASGYTIALGDFLERFMGKSDVQMFKDVQAETGLNLAGSFPAEALRQKQEELFRTRLKAIPGVHDVLNRLDLPSAVASGSPMVRLELTLGLTQLTPFFDGHIYSAEMVKNGKPAPDVFLLAAEKLGVAPERCLAIEDSPNGLRAAKAAGMTVCAFTGGSHMTTSLKSTLAAEKPFALFQHMSAWPGPYKLAA